jgi:hypothetical protein
MGAHDKYDNTKGWGPHGVVACEQPWSARGVQVQMMRASAVVVVVVGSARVDAISGEGEWSAHERERWGTANDVVTTAYIIYVWARDREGYMRWA